MSLRRAAPLVVAPTSKHTASVIFTHGLGDDGYGWAPMVQNWRRRSKLNEVKFILPHAPSIPVTCNMRYPTPAWYDLITLDGSVEDMRKDQDEAGLNVTREYLRGLIQAEIDAGIKPERIVLGGFSQGGAMSLYAGITSKVKLGGIIGMSSYLPLDNKIPDLLKESDLNKETPIGMFHGDADSVVPTAFGKMSAEMLKKLGFKDVSVSLYHGMEHSACPEELDDVEEFLVRCLPPTEGEKKSEL